MPISLPPIETERNDRPSRRRFLAGSLAAAAGLLLPGGRLPVLRGADAASFQPAADPDRFALLSDIHIAGDRKTVYRGVNMFDNLQRVCGEVTARRPAAAFIDGDLAFLRGRTEDYATVVESLKPLRRGLTPPSDDGQPRPARPLLVGPARRRLGPQGHARPSNRLS